MLKLVKLEEKYKKQLFEMMDEWTATGEKIVPYAIRKTDYHDFNKYLEDIEVKEETKESVLDSTYFALDIERDIFVGAVNIRHYLNKQLLKNGGHIGDGVRPSERRKGYATEMIRLALEECKKLRINRVLMVCYKDNIGSAKSIINNGGILENEVPAENGKIDQRYWISLKKRFADDISKNDDIENIEQKIKKVNNNEFKGDIYLNHFIKIKKPYLLPNGICIRDNGYKWLEFYDYNSKIKLTAIYNQNNEIVEWYFDIARSIGKENGIPFEDDLYLDVVLRGNGETVLLDEDELKEAYERMEMTKEEYDEAYKIAYDLISKIKGKTKEIKNFTDKYLNEIMMG